MSPKPLLALALWVGLVGCSGRTIQENQTVAPECGDAGLCQVTPADFACDADADCTILEVPSCADVSLLGVNRNYHATCAPPQCPLGASNAASAYSYVAQDCTKASSVSALVVHCVDQECRTSFGCPTCHA